MIPVPLDFTAAQSILTDLSQQQQQGRITFIQSLYIDNSQNTAFVDIISSGNNLRYRVPPGSEAILPFFVQNPPTFVCNSTGNVIVPFFVMNVPLNPQVWSSGASGGVQAVSDAALEALITNPVALGNGLGVYDLALLPLIDDGGLNVNVISGGGGGTSANVPSEMMYNVTLDNSSQQTQNGNPSSGNCWFMTRLEVRASYDFACSGAGAHGAGSIEWQDNGAGDIGGEWTFDVPIAGGASVVFPAPTVIDADFASPIYSPGGNGNSMILKFTGQTITSGALYVSAWGYQATFP